ncbi:GDSL esterase lipase [Musa troglodytarum]|uniref:GDSL esterase lipase n=1 Tax=Musa troglodytarum TaxID=320322 RepID=A0A9E7HZL2_9LILI|nr:GDSL esterase lipase [Musa troglodytarum]
MAHVELRGAMLGARWLLLLLALSSSLGPAQPEPQVPCYFIFGDSLVDNGNNNNIASLAVANYPPYGVDFAGGPTGRFTNGLTTVDVIGSVFSASNKYFPFPLLFAFILACQCCTVVMDSKPMNNARICGQSCHKAGNYVLRPLLEFRLCAAKLLGFHGSIPPYASTRGQALLAGVNFASAAAGILEETGRQLGGRIPFSGQLQNYRSAVQEIVRILGGEETAVTYLSKCIFSVGMGNNDYLNNYFMPALYGTSRRYTPEQYADVLIQQYSQQLRTLYNYGARKVALIGVRQVGCSPIELAQRSPDGVTCVEEINSAIRVFNAKLIGVVDELNASDGAHFIYINGYGIFEDIMRNSAAYGVSVTNRGCCGVGRNNGQITCLPYQAPCANRNEYLFFDAFHPTEAANVVIGKRSYSARSPSDAYRMDIRRLAKV